jgi:hypothetical protein
LDSETAYQAHLKSHVQCTDCDFQGAPKVVKAHHQTIHGKFSKGGFKTVTVAIPGCKVQRFRICVGSRPEDVQKWIAERKKRFPRRSETNDTLSSSTKEESKANTSKEKQTTAKPETGLSSLLDGYGSSSDEEEAPAGPLKVTDTTAEDSPGKDVPKIMPMHSQMSPDNDEERATKDDNNTTTRQNKRICRFFARNGTCRNGDACHFRHEKPDPNKKPSTHNAKLQRKRKEPPKSLLRSLLSNDIQRENTLTLQLLRHIVDRKFFDENE